ncbi:MAG: diguanylate cyclase [Candidatus Tantalella remota]|nr:diguanylate cyclase [Candidatus Tantalella remota]
MKEDKRYILDILSAEFLDQTPLIVVGFDLAGNIIYWNKQAQKVTGYSKKEAVSLGITLLKEIFIHDDSADMSHSGPSHLEAVLAGRSSFNNEEMSVTSKTGEVRHVHWNSMSVKGSSGGSADKALIVTGLDITTRHLLQHNLKAKNRYIQTTTRRLRKYISLDPHTGLMNYRHFIQKLNNAFCECVDEHRPLSLLIMDVDYFCSINNIHGVSQGNQILRKLAMLIRQNVYPSFTVARFSGSEFAILMPGTDIKTAFSIAGKLFSRITDHNFGMHDFSLMINLSLSMALGGYPHCEDVCLPEQLLDRVTGKLREAKRTGANSILICSPNETLAREAVEDENPDAGRDDYRYTVEFVNALANTVKTKDFYTQEHSSIMSNYAVYMADYMGMNAHEVRNVKFGSLLHDIGKIGIDKMILLKPGSLTKTEFEVIKQHPRIGAEIIRNVHPLKDVVPYVLYHHERFDGSGYLGGLKGDEIPLGARIISLADVFQALTSDRPYRKALPEKDALAIVRSYTGKYFDPDVAKSFFEVYRSIE